VHKSNKRPGVASARTPAFQAWVKHQNDKLHQDIQQMLAMDDAEIFEHYVRYDGTRASAMHSGRSQQEH
jgi:mevalonate pyrophosphate decarboxylase